MLSQWRAYAQDGRGGAITLDKKGLDNVVGKLRGLRVNPVFYDASLKATFVNAILAEGFRRHGTPGSPAIDETVRALLYCAPLMKHEGFSEEREWRLIYVSPANVALPRIHFHPRRDFLAPYLDLNDFWATHPPSSALDPPPNIPGSVGKPYTIVGQAYRMKGDWHSSLKFEEEIADNQLKAGETPKKETLQLILSSCVKLNDKACEQRARKRLLRYYPP